MYAGASCHITVLSTTEQLQHVTFTASPGQIGIKHGQPQQQQLAAAVLWQPRPRSIRRGSPLLLAASQTDSSSTCRRPQACD